MPDIIDQANDMAQEMLDRNLAKRQQFKIPSHVYCEDCDEPIPPERRKLGGVIRCYDCQLAHDNQLKHFTK